MIDPLRFRWRSRREWLFTLSVCGLLCRRSAAQGPTDSEGAFQHGLEEMHAGRYDTACPLLADSYRLDPLPGVLFTLAECEAAWGKVATAVEQYQSFLSALPSMPSDRRAKFDERRDIALDKIAALSALVPEIVVIVPPTAPASVVVKRNGVVLEPTAYGVSKKVDPGQYVVSLEIDGAQLWERHLSLETQDRGRVEIPWPLPSALPGAPPAANRPAGTPVVAARADPSNARWVYVTGGIGIAGLTAGLVAGGIALSHKNTVDYECPQYQCSPAGKQALDSANHAATVSTVAFSVGVVGVGAAIALLLWSPPDAPHAVAARPLVRTSATVNREGAVFSVQGSF